MLDFIDIDSTLREISISLNKIDFKNYDYDDSQLKIKICFLLVNLDSTLNEKFTNIEESEKHMNDILLYLIDIVIKEFPKEKSNIGEIKTVLTGSLSGQDKFNLLDYISSRIIYTYAMNIESRNLNGVAVMTNFYEKYIYNQLKILSNNTQLKEAKLSITINDEKQTVNLLNRAISGGRSEYVDVKIAKYVEFAKCSRVHFLILYYNDIDEKPTIAIVDPGSFLGISENNNGYSIKEQVFYMKALNDNKMVLKVGEIIVEFSAIIDN